MEDRADTFTAYHNGKPIFTSNSNWLHPIFELEQYLAKHTYDIGDIHVEDTIIGKAAAILLCRIGISSVDVGILSRLGEQVLKSRNVRYTSGKLVDRISCETEDILEPIDDFDEAYVILQERAAPHP
jgi:zinc transport system ATP-binding protein